jgi:hypothetical protein
MHYRFLKKHFGIIHLIFFCFVLFKKPLFILRIRGVAVTCKMVVMPTAQYPAGRVLLEDEGLDGYCIDKKMRDGVCLFLLVYFVVIIYSISQC